MDVSRPHLRRVRACGPVNQVTHYVTSTRQRSTEIRTPFSLPVLNPSSENLPTSPPHRHPQAPCGWRIVISHKIPQDSPSCYDSVMRDLGRSFYPLHCYPGPLARTWRRPFHSCGVASPQAPTPDRESPQAPIAESMRVGPHPRRLDGALGASYSSAPVRNRTEAVVRQNVIRPEPVCSHQHSQSMKRSPPRLGLIKM